MKALVYHGPHEMRWEDWPDPQPGPGEAVVAVRAVGICGSDLRGYTGESSHRKPPMVMGHEATGEIIALGPDVPEGRLGMRVVIRPDLVCETCDECRAGRANRCRKRRLVGVHTQGAMAERVAVPVSNLLPLPDRVSFVHGALVEPLTVGMHAARQAGDLSGCSVLIAGSGPIGLLTLVAARHADARTVVATDIIPKRRATAMVLGADAALDPTEERWTQRLADAFGKQEVDVAFDAVGIPATFQQAIQAIRPGGTLVAIGGWRTVPLDLNHIVRREIQLRGTFNYTPDEFNEARLWLEEGRFDPRRLVTNVRPLAEGATAFAELTQNRTNAIKVVLASPEVSP